MGTFIPSRKGQSRLEIRRRFDCEGSRITQAEDVCLSQDLPPPPHISSTDRELGTILSMAQAGKIPFLVGDKRDYSLNSCRT